MSEWREVKLKKVIKRIFSGGTPSTKREDYWGGELLWLSSGETNKKYISDTEKKITELGAKESSTKLAKKNSVVIASAGQGKTRGQVSFLKRDMFINQSIIAIEVDEEYILPKYLLFNLSSRYNEIRILSDASSSRGSITTGFLNKLTISVPNINTQKKIVNILSGYDELIENNNRRIQILEQTAEELYKEWFVRMRFPGYENAKFDKGIPEGWEVTKIGEMATFKRGKNLRIADAIEGDVPVIAGGIEPSCYHNESNTKAPVITVSASGANAGYTRLNFIDVWASDCSYIDAEDSELIYYIYLLMKVSQKEILNLQLGSAQPHVYARDLNNFSFLKPPQNLIKEMNKQAQIIFNEVKILNIQNQNLTKQRDLLLPRLMNGTITVK